MSTDGTSPAPTEETEMEPKDEEEESGDEGVWPGAEGRDCVGVSAECCSEPCVVTVSSCVCVCDECVWRFQHCPMCRAFVCESFTLTPPTTTPPLHNGQPYCHKPCYAVLFGPKGTHTHTHTHTSDVL
ncbi:Cysteine-rich protein 2 [Bagarius yarrelli]|uniref:Cysteine-rich protein 2 n=1 Tax=Bagarius yarrelli TaxID=175774 RepID=A0A556VW61_BAGYA|nr:Cysteine-rich protein 2 [Bagarius yarrelli]